MSHQPDSVGAATGSETSRDVSSEVSPPGDQPRPRQLELEVLSCVLVSASLLVVSVAETVVFLRVAGAALSIGSGAYIGLKLFPPRNAGAAVVAAVGLGVGIGLVAAPGPTLNAVTMVVGVTFVALGLWFTLREVDERGGLRRLVTVGALLVPVGLALLVLAESVLTVTLWLGAAVLAAHAGVRVGQRLSITHVPERESRPLLVSWVAAKGPRPEAALRVADALFFEGPAAFTRSARFALLMLFAAVISAVGVLTDSTAIVIGAMLIAPLISPMMGMGLSTVMGWPGRLARSAALVVVGVVLAIGTGWLLAAVLDLAVDLEANTQITSRSSPGVADLLVAVAAGAAGAYALSRDDVSSSLPGVAVSIALVPPLSVIGIAAQQGDWGQAAGTALLFLTNFLAILLVGGAVFVLTGVAPLPRETHHQHRVAVAAGVAGVVALFVVAALLLNSAAIVQDSLDVAATRRSVTTWLGSDSDLTIVSVDVDSPDITIVLAGSGDPPDPQALATALRDELDHRIRLDLQWIPRQRELVSVDATE